MKLSRSLFTFVPIGVMAAAMLAPVLARADTTPASSTEQLVSSVLTLKQIGKLGLTQAQLREIIQQLSTLSHAQQVFAGHQADAATPVMEPLRRIKAALQAGNTPDAADQTAVDQALAGLRTEQIHVEQLRTETIRAIRQALTANQMTTLRDFLGMDAPNEAGVANGDTFYFGVQRRLDNKLDNNPDKQFDDKLDNKPDKQFNDTLDRKMKFPADPAQVPMDIAFPPAPQVKAQAPADAARPVPQLDVLDPNLPADLPPAAAADERQLADTAQEVAITAQKQLVQALRAAGAATAGEPPFKNTDLVINDGLEAAPAPPRANDQEMNARMAKLEAEMAQMERMLQKLLGANEGAPRAGGGLKPGIMHEFKLAPRAPGRAGTYGPVLMTPPVREFNGKGGYVNVYATNGGSADDDVIARFFLQPDMLTYLRSLAAR